MLGSFVQLMVVTGILGAYIAGIGVRSLQKRISIRNYTKELKANVSSFIQTLILLYKP